MLRVLFYCFGMFLIALGAVITINANLGVSPVTSLPYVLSLVTNMDVGITFVAFYIVLIIIQIILLRKNFKWINLTQILFSTVFGYFIILAEYVVGDFVIPSYPGRLLMLLVGVSVLSLGITIYVGTKLVPVPSEGLVSALAQLLNRPFAQIKIAFDCTVVLCAVIISFIAFGELRGIREGTVICSILIGLMIKGYQKAVIPALNKICFEPLHGL